jgi:hypothetical protein
MLSPTWFTCHGITQPLMLRGSDLEPWTKQRRMLHGHPDHVDNCAECRDLTVIQGSLVDMDSTVQVYPAK